MSDQGRWFKLWCCSLSDQVLSNLDIADFGRWSKLGTYIKENGTNGVLQVPLFGDRPARFLVELLQVANLDELLVTLHRLPNIASVTYDTQNGNGNVTYLTVTYKNWRRWQGDWSRDRVAAHRAKKRNEIPSSSSSIYKRVKEESEKPLESFAVFWDLYPKKVEKPEAIKAWKKLDSKTRAEIIRILPAYKFSSEARYIKNPSGWLNGQRWKDETSIDSRLLVSTDDEPTCKKCKDSVYVNKKTGAHEKCPDCGRGAS